MTGKEAPPEERPTAPAAPRQPKQTAPARTRRRPDARIVGREGEARTPYADSAVTTRNPSSSGG